jgi:hypothetical protein
VALSNSITCEPGHVPVREPNALKAVAEAPRPKLRWHAVLALREVLVATVIPLLVFALSQARYGTTVAIAETATWTLGVTLIQARCRGRVSGLIILSLIMLAIKATSGLATGSSFLFFAVPCLGTAATGAMFAWSGRWKRPLLVRLARDVVPFLEAHLSSGASRPFILRLGWTWGAAYLANAIASFLLLVFLPLHVFMVLHVLAGWSCTGLAAVATLFMARRHGPHLLHAIRGSKAAQPVVASAPVDEAPKALAA